MSLRTKAEESGNVKESDSTTNTAGSTLTWSISGVNMTKQVNMGRYQSNKTYKTTLADFNSDEIERAIKKIDKGLATKPPKYHCSKCGLDYYRCPPFCRKCGGKVVEKGNNDKES